MTVRELIEHLSQFPLDVEVICTFCSDYSDMDAENITLIKAADKKVIKRGGRFCHPYEAAKWPKDEAPVYMTVVHFPGN